MGGVMRFALLSIALVVAGCDGVGVGNRRAVMLTPEERILVQDYRDGKPVAVKSDPTVRPMSADRGLLDLMSSPTMSAETSYVLKDEVPPVAEPIEDLKSFRWSWDRGYATPGKASKDNPEYDDSGNLIVDPEVYRAYKIPDLHSGVGVDLSGDFNIRALIEVELAEFRVPKAGWFSTGILAGEQFLGWHVSKEWIRVFEIETGMYVGYDFETDDNVFGLTGLIIKF
jgi:hypothetical protein